MLTTPTPAPLALLVRHAQWVIVGEVVTVVWDAAQPTRAETYPDQVLRVAVHSALKDTRGRLARWMGGGRLLVHKPYSVRRLAVGDGGLFFLTRNAVPTQGGPPFDATARATGDLHVGLSQPYRVGRWMAAWVSNGQDAPLPLARLDEVQAALAVSKGAQ